MSVLTSQALHLRTKLLTKLGPILAPNLIAFRASRLITPCTPLLAEVLMVAVATSPLWTTPPRPSQRATHEVVTNRRASLSLLPRMSVTNPPSRLDGPPFRVAARSVRPPLPESTGPLTANSSLGMLTQSAQSARTLRHIRLLSPTLSVVPTRVWVQCIDTILTLTSPIARR